MSEPLRILQIAPRYPYPPKDGGRIGIYNITKSVAARGHDVHFACFGMEDSDLSGMQDFCSVYLVPHDTENSMFGMLANLPSSWPYTISKYRSAAMVGLLQQLTGEHSFDVVHVDHAHMAPYGALLKRERGLPYVLREHNFETTIYRRFGESQTNPLFRSYMRMQTSRLQRFECSQLRHPDRIAAITGEDAAIIQAHCDRTADIIPAGVDLERFPVLGRTQEVPMVTILGSLRWQPHLDGVRWFVEKVIPLLREQRPDATVVIAGEHPPAWLRAKSDDGLHVPGFVDDLVGLLERTSVLAVPLHVGGGMRIKLLEYFASGKAVVSTPVGAEGNAACDGEHLLLADDADSFAAALVRLLCDGALRVRLGDNARALAEERYSWDVIAAQFEDAYRGAMAMHAKEAS